MPRIRSIHPSQWTDENFVECSFGARLLVISVRNETDDNGIFEWKPKTLKMKLFPADNIEIDPILEELIQTKQIMKFEVNGIYYGMVRNFQRYQRPEKPKFIYPVPAILPTGYSLNNRYSPIKDEDSDSNRRPVADQSAKPVSEGTGTGKGVVHSSELVRTNSSECVAHPQKFSDLEFSGRFEEIATEAKITGQAAIKCWKKFKVNYHAKPASEALKLWQIWVMNEFIKPVQPDPPDEIKLSPDDIRIQVLGAANWKRQQKIKLDPEQARILEKYENDNGVVWWTTLNNYKSKQTK